MRYRLIAQGKIYSTFPKDPVVKSHYYKLLREYNKVRKFKRKNFQNSILNQLDALQNKQPKEYWKLINDLKNHNKDNSAANIDPDTWVNHFVIFTLLVITPLILGYMS